MGADCVACVHHWRIDSPENAAEDGTVGAVCRYCGARRTYPRGWPGDPVRSMRIYAVRGGRVTAALRAKEARHG